MCTNNKEFIKDAFHKVVGSTSVDEQIVADFFHPKYQQYVDGVQLDFTGFIQHMKAQKEVIESIAVSFRNIITEADIVFTNHDVTIKKRDGGTIWVHVLAEFTLSEGKIIQCDELTRLEKGDIEDANIGSRIK